MKIYSNRPVQATIENTEEQDKGLELVKYRISRSGDALNEYIVSLSVPREITHQFESQLILTYPATGKKLTVPISFTGQDGSYFDSSSYSSTDEGEGILERATNYLFGASTVDKSRSETERSDYQSHGRPRTQNYFG